jgi:hypothetical protein
MRDWRADSGEALGNDARWLVAVMTVVHCAYLNQGAAFLYRLELDA